jgi:hypothetical protein
VKLEDLEVLQKNLNGWRSELLLTSTKQPKPLLANALIALRHAFLPTTNLRSPP